MRLQYGCDWEIWFDPLCSLVFCFIDHSVRVTVAVNIEKDYKSHSFTNLYEQCSKWDSDTVTWIRETI